MCDFAAGPRKWLQANFPDVPLDSQNYSLKWGLPEASSQHVRTGGPLGRGGVLTLSVRSSSQVGVYVCGFPCKAFSFLRRQSKRLDDPSAVAFWHTRDRIRQIQPRASRFNFTAVLRREFWRLRLVSWRM